MAAMAKPPLVLAPESKGAGELEGAGEPAGGVGTPALPVPEGAALVGVLTGLTVGVMVTVDEVTWGTQVV